MRKPIPLSILVILAIALIALPALAESFTVKLKSGESFMTRYRPHAASWDPEMVMLLTDFGHWIALPRADIEIVESDFESRGFGKIIDTVTIDLGIAPNDLPAPGDEQAPSALEQLQSILEQERSYDVQQFISPGQAGRSGGGLPVSYGSGIGGGSSVITVTEPGSGGGGGGGGG